MNSIAVLAERPLGRKSVSYIPGATYRLQFNKDFTLKQAQALIPYWAALGITTLYSSPLSTARPGSTHGYDVADHGKLNPEIGTPSEFEAFCTTLKQHQMGLILDVVPNHMCITTSNAWWNDVLENGPSSPYSRFFDILWTPPLKKDLADKVLLPFLGDQFGRLLENKDIQVFFEEGAFFVQFYSSRLPLNPKTWIIILEPVLDLLSQTLGDEAPVIKELASVLTALRHMPERTDTDPEKVKERIREREIARQRLQTLTLHTEFSGTLAQVLIEINGSKGDPRSFDRLETLLEQQGYRLSFWKVASDEINYRRFFDISELAAVRIEEPEVFEEVHQLAFELIEKGLVQGLRIDHIDGLFDPKKYLSQIQEAVAQRLGKKPPFYVIVEKILENGEQLREEWQTQGTTGYDFLNQLNSAFINPAHKGHFFKLYYRITNSIPSFPAVLADCKRILMNTSLASELRMLAYQCDRIAAQHRWSRDFTMENLRFALREVIAFLPVYRTYIQSFENEIRPEDEQIVTQTIRQAKRKNPTVSGSFFEFIENVLLLRHPEGLSEDQIERRRRFVMGFQQFTGPVMAKGLEDTAFYRFFPLVSINEVGGSPNDFGINLDRFHEMNKQRLDHWPLTMTATTTHDTKRNEDVRARINVLSEIPAKWYRTVRRWQNWNHSKKTFINGMEIPDANDEYLLYQTLIGSWPLENTTGEMDRSYCERIKNYMTKAVNEAKIYTSWMNPDETYTNGVIDFVEKILTPDAENRFLKDFLDFQGSIQPAGLMNALSQVLLKIASPGVPDFYQGTEVWNFSLVDPDNRRPVDYDQHQELFRSLNTFNDWDRLKDDRIKLSVTSRCLSYRRENPDLFRFGAYTRLNIQDEKEDHSIGFMREWEGKTVLAVAGRFFMSLNSWGETRIILPNEAPDRWKNIITGEIIESTVQKNQRVLLLSRLLSTLPVALLEPA